MVLPTWPATGPILSTKVTPDYIEHSVREGPEVIRAQKKPHILRKVAELYSYRELLKNLVVKELKLKYKSSFLGFLWSLINPLFLMLIYTLVFSVIFSGRRIEHFPLFLIAGLLPWTSFASSLNMTTNSIIGNRALIGKIYVPRELFPFSVVLANAFSFIFEMLLLFVPLAILGYNFYRYLPIVVLAFVLQTILAAGFGLALSSVTVYFRDMKQLITLILRLWFYVTPILYPFDRLEMLPEVFQSLFRLNPMASIVMLYKLPLYYNKMPGISIFAGAFISAGVVFAIGYIVFARLEPNFARDI